MVNILLVESHTVVRKGIISLIEASGEIRVICEAADPAAALQLISDGCNPDIVIVDLNTPEAIGVDFLKKVSELNSNIRILIFSMIDHEKHVLEALKNGAYGYLQKNTGSEEFIFAIKHIAAGNKYICSDIAIPLIEKLYEITKPAGMKPENVHLTNREIVVLRLIAEGFTNNEIANKLFTSRRTVEGHRQSLIDKTGSKNSAALIRYAVKAGII